MPMGMSLVLLYEELNEKTRLAGGHVDARAPNFALTLLLGIAYSASIGGVATLIGTPPIFSAAKLVSAYSGEL